MDVVGIVHYNGTDQPSPRRIMELLLLPCTDDTQTALANENIHVSETQAIQWRKIAREDSITITGNGQSPKPRAEKSIHHACIARCAESSCIIS